MNVIPFQRTIERENRNDIAVEQIGQRLKSAYQAMVEAPVPDRFTALLGELERAEAERAPDKSSLKRASQ
ncbi:NepR family anti-sigma factor [Roseitalea sp. MMSF_3516]|uniref:NepR family anti-sigma factor n=1 Tax=Roseitalea sp. MMSF_3516 TaxID=3046719 RepID=UPI00273D471C|nr:NepR family anti-sigma factor [Roseitalea sp. MMSF_3516]